MSSPRTSGMLTGGGAKRPRRYVQTSEEWGRITLTDGSRIKQEVPDYEEGQTYTKNQLMRLADKILREDSEVRPIDEYPAILFLDHLRVRARREIYVASGTPDPSIACGLYNRSHPQGRALNSDEQRRKGCGFYVR